MPLFYQRNIIDGTKIGVWHIAEPESFFLQKVPLKRDITYWHKRLQHLAGRYLLQELFPGFPYHLIEIADTRKPFLPNEEYHFSISHCGDYAAVIASENKRVGIDIEIVTPKIDRIKHKFLSEEELEKVDSWELADVSEDGNRLLTLLWSCKEAVFKWDGDGGVDFRKDIHLKSYQPDDKIINCDFWQEIKTRLQIRYHFFDKMCLAWIS